MSNEYSQGIAHDGAAILKDGQPMTIDEIVGELRLLAAAQAEARELQQSRREAIDMANDNALLASEAMQERDELRTELARVREAIQRHETKQRHTTLTTPADLELYAALSQPAEQPDSLDSDLRAQLIDAGWMPPLEHSADACPNCATDLPKGCGGIFADETECRWVEPAQMESGDA